MLIIRKEPYKESVDYRTKLNRWPDHPTKKEEMMSKDRMGRVERWILTHAYLKQFLKLPEGWIEHNKVSKKYYQNLIEIDGIEYKYSGYSGDECNKEYKMMTAKLNERFKEMQDKGLCKDEVLFNYFKVPSANERPKNPFGTHRSAKEYNVPDSMYSNTYWTGKKYQSAMVGYRRSVLSLVQKGLVRVWYMDMWGRENWEDKDTDWVSTFDNFVIFLTDEGKNKVEKFLNIKRI